jgi:hypothetical protein
MFSGCNAPELSTLKKNLFVFASQVYGASSVTQDKAYHHGSCKTVVTYYTTLTALSILISKNCIKNLMHVALEDMVWVA